VSDLKLISAVGETPPSFARVQEPTRAPLRVALVQQRWHPDAEEHRGALAEAVRMAAGEGAKLVCLQELTLSPYFAITADGPQAAGAQPESVPDGPTCAFAAQLAREVGVHVHASLYERADADDGLGFNTAIVMAPDGTLAARTRKLHIPVTSGYYEDKYFRPGPPGDDAFPVVELGDARWRGPRSWSTRPPSAPSPTTRTSTPSRCGSGSSSPTGSPTGRSWSPSTGSAPRIP
jgi:N-carbamoylputrescine amidase